MYEYLTPMFKFKAKRKEDFISALLISFVAFAQLSWEIHFKRSTILEK